ncbi:MAG TPA: rhodanese-like domain-containing protein [Steroidobacteraceae bacterium]|nr:rhodanese-like domain-containing protein [Steroidobacteraceae bacterium]
MDALLHIIEAYGLWVVFIAVLLDQGGLPLPAYPPIIVTSALAVRSGEPIWDILLVATLAAVLADILWFLCGRRFGAALLDLMCRLSLSPDSCVSLTRRAYSRWGPSALIVAKYIPGFAAVATVLAGESATSLRRFILFDAMGALLWVGGAVALGATFHQAVATVLGELERLGNYATVLLLAAIALYVVLKWWQRRRFIVANRMARISPEELSTLMQSESRPAVLDVRLPERRAQSGWIPGSVHAPQPLDLSASPDQEIVVYCDCPNEASAARIAKQLKARGFVRVRPLTGGLEAWRARGLPIETA